MTVRRILTDWRLLATLVAIVLPVTIAVGWAAGSADPEPDSEQRTPLPVRVVHAELEHESQRRRSFTGAIQAGRDSRLSFERGGRLVEIMVDEGTTVSADQRLARIDVSQQEAALRSLQAQRTQARAVLAELEQGPRAETIASAKARVRSLSAQAERTRRVFQRNEQLFRSDAISEDQFDTAKFGYEIAQADRDAAQRVLDELLAGTRAEQIAAQRAMVQQLEAEIARAEHDLEDGELRAPYAGTIAQRMADEGTVVDVGEPVFHLIESDTLEAWMGLPSRLAEKLTIGQLLEVDIAGQSYSARVYSRRPQVDPVTRTQNVILRIDDDAATALVPGQIVRLGLDETVSVSGVRLPSSALLPAARGLWNVYVLVEEGDGYIVEPRTVEVLLTIGDESVVRGTIQATERVVVSGVHRLATGQPVSPVPFDDTAEWTPRDEDSCKLVQQAVGE